MRIKIKRKTIHSAEQQIITNKLLVSNIKDTLNYLEPELCEVEILEKLLVMLIPMAETEILSALNDFLNSLGEKKLDEVKELYSQFFDETETPNNN